MNSLLSTNEDNSFKIYRKGFFTYEYDIKYSPLLQTKITEEDFTAMLKTIERIHRRFEISVAYFQALIIFIVLTVISGILLIAIFTPFMTIATISITLLCPSLFLLVRNMMARDQQIATVSSFLSDANSEFARVGVQWYYEAPGRPIRIVVGEFGDIGMDDPYSTFNFGLNYESEEFNNNSSFPVLKSPCTCLFFTYDDLIESGSLISSHIPVSNHQNLITRISIFPSGRMRLTISVALRDVQSSWTTLQYLQKLESSSSPLFSVWEHQHIMDSSHLLRLLSSHINE